MPDSTIDLIDGAVEAWETSKDAMRWRPDAPAVDDWFAVCAELPPLTDWQVEFITRVFDVPVYAVTPPDARR